MMVSSVHAMHEDEEMYSDEEMGEEEEEEEEYSEEVPDDFETEEVYVPKTFEDFQKLFKNQFEPVYDDDDAEAHETEVQDTPQVVRKVEPLKFEAPKPKAQPQVQFMQSEPKSVDKEMEQRVEEAMMKVPEKKSEPKPGEEQSAAAAQEYEEEYEPEELSMEGEIKKKFLNQRAAMLKSLSLQMKSWSKTKRLTTMKKNRRKITRTKKNLKTSLTSMTMI